MHKQTHKSMDGGLYQRVSTNKQTCKQTHIHKHTITHSLSCVCERSSVHTDIHTRTCLHTHTLNSSTLPPTHTRRCEWETIEETTELRRKMYSHANNGYCLSVCKPRHCDNHWPLVSVCFCGFSLLLYCVMFLCVYANIYKHLYV